MADAQSGNRRGFLRTVRVLPVVLVLFSCPLFVYIVTFFTSGKTLSSYPLQTYLPFGVVSTLLALSSVASLARHDLEPDNPAAARAASNGFGIWMGMSLFCLQFLPLLMHPSFVPFGLGMALLFGGMLTPLVGAYARRFVVRRRMSRADVAAWEPDVAQEPLPDEGHDGAAALALPTVPSESQPRTISRRTFLAGTAVVTFSGGSFVWFIRSLPSLVPALAYRGHADDVTALAWAPDRSRIASGDTTGAVRVWESATGHDRLVYTHHSTWILAVAWSPDGSLVASSSEDGAVQWWHPDDASTVNYTLTASARGISWSPDGRRLAVANGPEGIQIYDVATAKLLFALKLGDDEIGNVSWSPGGRYIAGRPYVADIQVWDVAARSMVATIGNLPQYDLALAWSPDGRFLAYPRDYDTVAIAVAGTGRTVATYESDLPTIEALSWSPDGRYLAAGGGEAAPVWEVATGRTAFVWRGNFAAIQALAWSPDGRYIASGGYDQTVRVWRPGI